MPLPKEINCTVDDIYNLPEGERAELIDGKLYMMAPPSRHDTYKRIMYLPRQPRGVPVPDPSLAERGKLLMSTYEELSLIVSVALLIVAILTYTNKK